MLIDDPQLLAIADAIVATQPARDRSRTAAVFGRPTRPSRNYVPVAAAIAALAAGVFLLLVSPWQHAPSLTEQALAAIGDQPVLHVVTTQDWSDRQPQIDLDTGRVVPRTLRTEIWFDQGRDLKKTIYTLDGKLLDDQLETAGGGLTTTGPIYTCAWIKTHQESAATAGVSCGQTESADTRPSLDPALADFVDHYASALVSGDAREIGRDTIGGRDVIWLQFGAGSDSERVALDTSTYRPVLLVAGQDATRLHVATAETVPYSSSVFTKPVVSSVASGGSISSEDQVTPAEAGRVLAVSPVWLGETWSGLVFQSAVLQERALAPSPATPRTVAVVKFTYAPSSSNAEANSGPRIEIYESRECLISVGWSCTPRDPASNRILGYPLGTSGFVNLLRRGDLYVSIWKTPDSTLPAALDIARALEIAK